MKSVMISGNFDITPQEFEQYYQTPILEAIGKKYSFVVGGNKGFERTVQNFLLSEILRIKEENRRALTMHTEGSEVDAVPVQKFVPQVTVYDLHNNDNRVDPSFLHKSGFVSYRKRDSQMTIDSRYDIAVLLRDSCSCGTCENIIRRELIKSKFRTMEEGQHLNQIYTEAIHEAKRIISAIRNNLGSKKLTNFRGSFPNNQPSLISSDRPPVILTKKPEIPIQNEETTSTGTPNEIQNS